MYKKILVPMALARTQATRSAVDVAERLLSEGGSITALHVLDRMPAMVSAALPKDHAQIRRDESMALLTEQLEGHDSITPAVIDGHEGRAIVDYAEANGCDLIVVASHKPDVTDLFLGSTAAWVVRHAKCAVHVTR